MQVERDLEQEAFRAAAGLLDDRVVILTGATGGIGTTIARMLVAAGARVAVTDLAAERVSDLVAELQCFGAATDASSRSSFGAFHAEVEDALGPTDGVVNCAGLWRPSPYD